MPSGFSVQGVEIEGFKGFTSPESIDFRGRHIFLLGQNGNGKSSIVEAVRWGLFGSAFRPNEVVKNQHYPGDCRVTVKLMRDGEIWTLRRRLNLGTGSSSDPILTDQQGTRHNMRQVMPQLDTVNAGEGTHIIFAPQSAPLRRQPEDLDPFERTVFNYLGLTHPRALLSNIEEFLEEHSKVENELDQELSEARSSIDAQINEEETRRRNILNAPPWESGPIPSVPISEQKARSLIEEVTGNPPSEDLDGLSLDALIERTEESLGERRAQSQGSLEDEAKELAECRGCLEELRSVKAEVRTKESEVQCTQSRLEAIYDGLTPDELQEKLASAKQKATTESIRGRIVQEAIDLLDRDDADEVLCPICDSLHSRQSLESLLQNTVDHSTDNYGSIVAALETRIREAGVWRVVLTGQEASLRVLEGNAEQANSLVRDEDKRMLTETGDIDQLIEQYSVKEAAVRTRLDDQETWFTSKRAQLDKLRDESRFHRIQRRVTTLQANRRELEEVIDSYNHLVVFGESVRAIRDAIEARLSEQLAEEIPRVSEILSNAFSALTQHPWYDRLVISKDTLPKLQLRVASTHDPTEREDPTGVLNGQAESALNLVPYFAFSQSDDTPTEVYLVMLDDPTRALDTEHIRILVERLRELGRNVQLIVASQETERFQKLIPNVFEEDSYVVIEPTGWSPDSGPKLKIAYG